MGRPKGSKNKSNEIVAEKEKPFDKIIYNPPIKVVCVDANRFGKSKYLENGEEYECRYEVDTGVDVLYSIKIARSEWGEFSKDRFEKVEE